MKVSGEMTRRMDGGSTYTSMALSTKGNGLTTSKREMGLSAGLMAQRTMANTAMD
jgi:hypothetical protein